MPCEVGKVCDLPNIHCGYPNCPKGVAEKLAKPPACGDWRDADTAPKEGFILVWGPHHPEIAFTFDAGIFHRGRADDLPPHLSLKAFTKWTPLPKLPSAD